LKERREEIGEEGLREAEKKLREVLNYKLEVFKFIFKFWVNTN